MNHSPDTAPPASPLPGYWELTAGEPFRLLFLIGLFLGVVGVSLWPLHVWGVLEGYPAIPHQRVMIEGFLSAFVIGFLGTAMPRLLEVPPMRLGQTFGFAGLLLLASGLHLAGRTMAGDGVFLLMMLCLLAWLIGRFRLRRDLPPPQFAMVGMGMASSLIGAGVFLAGAWMPLPVWLYGLGPAFLYQSYLLLPILGIGVVLLPRFMGWSTEGETPDSPSPNPQWTRRAWTAVFWGGLILASFVLEAIGIGGPLGAAAAILRAVVIGLYILRELHGRSIPPGTLPRSFRFAFWTIWLGYLLIACWPQWRTAWLHVVFITGFNILTFVVATRVIFGHGGRSDRFRARLWPVILMSVCLWIAAISRIGGEWLPPAGRMLHFAYAALFWIIGTAIWAVAVLPTIRRADPDP